jgi:hypothetical protein
MFSLRAGLIALTLFCFDPNLLAHGAYVTTDMAASCTIFATIYLFWRYVTRPSLARLAAVGLAAGLALAAKHSTVLLAPMLVLLILGEIAARAFSRANPAIPNNSPSAAPPSISSEPSPPSPSSLSWSSGLSTDSATTPAPPVSSSPPR